MGGTLKRFIRVVKTSNEVLLFLQKDLVERQTRQIVQDIVGDIVSGVRSQPRPFSAIDSYITEEEKFKKLNPTVNIPPPLPTPPTPRGFRASFRTGYNTDL